MLRRTNKNWRLTMLKPSNAWRKSNKEDILLGIIIIIITTFVAVETSEEAEVTLEEGFSPG